MYFTFPDSSFILQFRVDFNAISTVTGNAKNFQKIFKKNQKKKFKKIQKKKSKKIQKIFKVKMHFFFIPSISLDLVLISLSIFIAVLFYFIDLIGLIISTSLQVLDGSLKIGEFDAFTQSDVYSYGLVMWEVFTRWNRTGNPHAPLESYRLPFHDSMPDDPSIEQAMDVVCSRRIRPTVNPDSEDQFTQSLVALMRECWSDEVLVRPTSLRLKKKLARLAAHFYDRERSEMID